MNTHGIYELSSAVCDLIGSDMEHLHSVSLRGGEYAAEHIGIMTDTMADAAHFANRLEQATFRADAEYDDEYIPVWEGWFHNLRVAVQSQEMLPNLVPPEPWPTADQAHDEAMDGAA